MKFTISALFAMLVDLIDVVETREELLIMLLKDLRQVGEAIFKYDESVSFVARLIKSFLPILSSKEKKEDKDLTELRHDVMHMLVTCHRDALESSEFWNTEDSDELSEGMLHFLDRKAGHEKFQRWYGSIPATVKSQLDAVLDRASEGVTRKRTWLSSSLTYNITHSYSNTQQVQEATCPESPSRLHHLLHQHHDESPRRMTRSHVFTSR
jgi:hypothetical protein